MLIASPILPFFFYFLNLVYLPSLTLASPREQSRLPPDLLGGLKQLKSTTNTTTPTKKKTTTTTKKKTTTTTTTTKKITTTTRAASYTPTSTGLPFCGGGIVGSGICPLGSNYCCSVHGYCGTTAAYCGAGQCAGGPCTPPSNSTSSIVRTCGGGEIGNKLCEDPSHCCSQYGWCDSSPTHCKPQNCIGGPCRTCGDGKLGTGLCPITTQCCNKSGYCGTGAEFCSLNTCFIASSLSSNNCRTCGNGIVGTGICPSFSDCCTSSGMCGSSSAFCSGNTCLSGPCTTPSSSPSSNNSKRLVTGYWTNWNSNSKSLKLSQVSSYYDIVAVAFGVRCNEHTISDGSVCFSVENLGVGYTNSQLKIDIATLKSRGQSVILSIGGGAVNGIIIVNSDKTVANFVSTTCALLTQYGFQGIDIDLENGINEFYLAKAIRQVQQKCGGGASGATQGYNSNSFILTFAPAPDDLLTSTSPYVTLIHSLSDLTTIVNTQLYNSGPLINALGNTVDPGTLDYLVSITELPILAGILLPHQTGIGIPAVASSCDSYACGSLASPTVLVNACSCLISGKNCGAYIPLTHYTSLGGVMIWNIDDEMTAGDGLAKSISDAFNTTLK